MSTKAGSVRNPRDIIRREDPLEYAAGARVSHYRLVAELGRGGMGVVWLADDERLARKVALKFITPASAGDDSARRRFEREARTVATLDHPNIATIYEVGEHADSTFIAMAFYEGETLAARLRRGAMDVSEILHIGSLMADGLAFAHGAGVVHRDIKPDNVFLTANGQVKILDFGLATPGAEYGRDGSTATVSGAVVGTPAYMSPEQIRGAVVDWRADVWALGVTLFEMAAGRRPFVGDSTADLIVAIATTSPPELRAIRREIPAEVAGVVSQALVKNPESRVLTAAQAATALRQELANSTRPPTSMRRRGVMIAVAVVSLALAAAAAEAVRREWNRRAAADLLAEAAQQVEREQYVQAVDTIRRAENLVGQSSATDALYQRATRSVDLTSDPVGATLSYTDYPDGDVWRAVGTSPANGVRLPLGPLRVRAELPGYSTSEDIVALGTLAVGLGRPSLNLVRVGEGPEGMVRVAPAPADFTIYIFGLESARVPVAAFWIDKYEVSNRQFKRFVDAGGYQRPEFWRTAFARNGRTLTFDEATAEFKDTTGRPGPASWILGSYPEGEGGLPVRGVSWHEAAAYAEFVGGALPTVFHWYRVATQSLAGFVAPYGNYGSAGPLPVDASKALHRFGAKGLAGNVKEWCSNEAPGGLRYVLGGAWDESAYMFRDADARAPFDRPLNVGFRTVRYDSNDSTVSALSGLVKSPARDYATERPATDEVFAAYRRLYTYDRTALQASLDATDDTNPDWRLESVSVDAAYGGERLPIYILLPKAQRPPYQSVIWMPFAPAWDARTPPVINDGAVFSFLAKSGRAVVFPVYKGSYQRGTKEYNGGDQLKSSNVWRDYVLMFAKDIGRTIDYLETRSDFDGSRIGYFGYSRGAALSPVFLATESRFKAAAVWLGGVYFESIAAEVDPINFLPRVTLPVLQINGRFDYNFPAETSAAPFFRLLGTPEAEKRLVMFDSGHNVPRNEAIRETLDWFDRHLGPVR